jgi:hypothetical protein
VRWLAHYDFGKTTLTAEQQRIRELVAGNRQLSEGLLLFKKASALGDRHYRDGRCYRQRYRKTDA